MVRDVLKQPTSRAQVIDRRQRGEEGFVIQVRYKTNHDVFRLISAENSVWGISKLFTYSQSN